MKRCDALYSQPIGYDFFEQDDWSTVFPDVALMTEETIDNFLHELGDPDTFRDMDADEREEYLVELLTENSHVLEPISNGIYPLPGFGMEAAMAQAYLVGSNVVVVVVDETPFLALSAGGMDCSWDLVEAYITLGYHPSIHFRDLPNMGLGPDQRELGIIEAMKKSISLVRSHLTFSFARLNAMETRFTAQGAKGGQA